MFKPQMATFICILKLDLLKHNLRSCGRKNVLAYLFFLAILFCVILADFFLTSLHFWFYQTLLSHFHLISQHHITHTTDITPFNGITSMVYAWRFTAIFVVIWLLYLYAISVLPARITPRFILLSTAVMGLGYCFVPVLTSQDILSYIAYARMVVFYHLDPLVNSPYVIRSDYIYHFLYWVDQPSVYGPLWTLLTVVVQVVALFLGFEYALSMEIFLRLFSLLAFLASVYLVWLLSGLLQGSYDAALAPAARVQRLRATLAFAWNPFLLIEACVNAHNDVTILFLILLAIWFLLPHSPDGEPQPFVWSAAFLGLAACIKISYIILIPGLLFYVFFSTIDTLPWLQRVYNTTLAAIVAFGVIVVLHMPFWHHGALLSVLKVTPSASRDINSIYEFGVNILHLLGLVSLQHTSDHGAPVEVYSHWLSDLLFVFIYGWICCATLRNPRLVRTPLALVSWLACVWLCYCFIGSPWFWPWYLILFFGLLTLVEACQIGNCSIPFILKGFDMGLVNRALSLGMFGLYVLWVFYNLLPGYRLHYLSSQLAWLLPLLFLGYVYWRRSRNERTLRRSASFRGDTA
jgi:hypothetical protein